MRGRSTRHVWAVLALPALLVAGCGARAQSVGGAQTTPTLQAHTRATATLHWKQVTLPTHTNPAVTNLTVSPADGHDAWVCVPGGAGAFTVWATHDTATTWQRVGQISFATPETASCGLIADQTSVRGLLATLSWGSGEAGTLRSASLFSSDGGAHWTSLSGYMQAQELATTNGNAIAILDNTTVSQEGDAMDIVVSSDGFKTWRAIRPAQLPAPFFHFWLAPSGGSLIATSYGNAVWRTDDLGAHWTQLPTPDEQTTLGAWVSQLNGFLLCGGSDVTKVQIQCSSDLGAHWTATDVPTYTTPCQSQKCGAGVTSQTQSCYLAGVAHDGSLVSICPDGRATLGMLAFTVYRLPMGSISWQTVGAAPGVFDLISATGPVWCATTNGDQVTSHYTAETLFSG